ncbi:HAD hydrolase-like protein [Agrobacterium vitis]|uniref:phosphoglycolate phosphatase n=1 Tax=Agrobacterium vitis TaxID=373 RepID=A0ABD6GJQ6_AGRVI|nr:HAD hydrolase-like protein [Agrobacterium vitis]MUO81942.1 HAD hydrolase-like protein [Agrobacterium vitis]MUO97045.1 HAD hydrolase-like protein [Agrobacterium vitis]MUP08090.1 HAD hydrolase-like protein [Agrobacterium vitis]MUZ80628.1 HAD hydrolase-like protein [Agrobacterium vitis]MVA09236.1 HAD hydrolase-like protein [Agrobacterium vitis]
MLLDFTGCGYCVLDYDDTIMQTRQCKISAIVELGRRMFSRDIARQEIEKHWGIAHTALFETVFSISGSQLDAALSQYAAMDSEFPLIPHRDAKSALEWLQTKYKLIIVSSCERQLIERQLAACELSTLKPARIYGCFDTKFHKPSGRVFDEMLVEFPDLDKANTVYIGDGIKDMQAARDAGLAFIGVDRAEAETAAILAAGGSVFSSLSQIAERLMRGHDAA